MNCQTTEHHLQAWLDGELSPSQARRLKKHVRECAVCSARLDGLRRLYDALSDLPGPPPALQLVDRTMLAARALIEERPLGSWWATLPTINKGMSVAALAAGLLLGVFLYSATFYSTAIAASTPSADTLTLFAVGQGDYL